MYRPRIGLVVSSIMVMLVASEVVAQAVPILPNTSSSTTTTTSTSTTSPTPSASPVDLAHLNWRFGQMSPYAQQPITGSATNQPVVPAPSPTTSNNNPFVASTLATQGSLVSTGTNSTTPAVQPTSSGASSTLTSSHYVSRFTSFETLTPTYGVNPSLPTVPTEPFVNLNTFTPPTLTLTSIPEPTTLIMCGGLLALVGYGYSRRRLKADVKTEEQPGDEPNEPLNV
ncbi:MAG: hypothetical protein QM703_16720 [Gemmatales bacterium]